MPPRIATAVLTVAAALVLCVASAQAFDDAKYPDLKEISKRPTLFSSERQGTLVRDPRPQDLPLIQQWPCSDRRTWTSCSGFGEGRSG